MFPNSFELLINATYKGGAAFRQAEGDAKDLGDAAEKSGKRTGDAMRQIGAAAGVAGAAFGAIALAAKGAWDMLNEGAALEAARSRFENLSESIGTTADSMLGKLREATSGMMSDAALMASATDLMSLGLGKTEESVVRLATVVGTLGWDMQQVVLTMANNSKMRLDALGLSVEDVDARVAKLRETGMSLDAAFDLAVIEAGEAKILLLGDAADTTEGKIKILTAQLKNAGDAFKAAFAEELASGIDEAAEGAGAMGENMVYAAEGAAQLVAQLAKLPMGFLVDMGKEARIDELRAQFIALGGDIEEVNKQIMAMPLKDTTFDDIATRNIELLVAGIAALEDATRRASPELKYLEGWKGVSAGTTEDATVALSEWTDEAKAAALALYELQSGAREWFAAEQLREAQDHIQGIVDGMYEAEDAAREASREIAIGLAEAFQVGAQNAVGYFSDAIAGLKDVEMPDMFSADGAGNVQTFNDAIYNMGVNAGASVSQLADLGVQTGQFTQEAADAAIKAQIFQSAMEGLARDWQMGKISTGDLIASRDEIIRILEETPVAEIEVEIAKRQAAPDFEPISVPVEPQWIEGDPTAMTGGPMKVPAQLDFTTDAMAGAVDFIDGMPDDARTIEMLIDASAVETGVEAIATAIQEMETTVVFTDPDVALVDAAVGKAETDIQAIDGKVEMYPDAALVWQEITTLSGKRIPVYVDFIPTGSPPAAGGGGGGADPGRSGRSSSGGWKVDMNVEFNGPVADPSRVARSLRQGLDEFYAGIRREGVAL